MILKIFCSFICYELEFEIFDPFSLFLINIDLKVIAKMKYLVVRYIMNMSQSYFEAEIY